MNTEELTNLFNECITTDGPLTKNQKIAAFIVRAKKLFADVTIADCKKISGFYSDDEKENANLSQSFRNNILIPTRIFITQKLYKLSEADAKEVWKQIEETDENYAQYTEMREAVNKHLPSRSRIVKSQNKMEFLGELLGL